MTKGRYEIKLHLKGCLTSLRSLYYLTKHNLKKEEEEEKDKTA